MGLLVSTDVYTMIYPLFKSINPKNIIGVSNLMDKIDKVNILKLGNNAKDILYYMYQNHTIIIEKDELYLDWICQNLELSYWDQNPLSNDSSIAPKTSGTLQ